MLSLSLSWTPLVYVSHDDIDGVLFGHSSQRLLKLYSSVRLLVVVSTGVQSVLRLPSIRTMTDQYTILCLVFMFNKV